VLVTRPSACVPRVLLEMRLDEGERESHGARRALYLTPCRQGAVTVGTLERALAAVAGATGAAAHTRQVGDFWHDLWLGAGSATGDAVRAALAHMRQLPY